MNQPYGVKVDMILKFILAALEGNRIITAHITPEGSENTNIVMF